MENWSKQISKNSHRDQLSFNYILWKNKDKNVKYISKQFSNIYFKQNKTIKYIKIFVLSYIH